MQRQKSRFGMQINGRSIKSVLLPTIKKRYGKKCRETRGLEFGNQELARTEKDRSEKAGSSEKIRKSRALGRPVSLPRD